MILNHNNSDDYVIVICIVLSQLSSDPEPIIAFFSFLFSISSEIDNYSRIPL